MDVTIKVSEEIRIGTITDSIGPQAKQAISQTTADDWLNHM